MMVHVGGRAPTPPKPRLRFRLTNLSRECKHRLLQKLLTQPEPVMRIINWATNITFLNLAGFSRLFSTSQSSFSTMVNSSTISPSLKTTDSSEVATVAAGCFWGTEHMYRKHFGNGKGLLDARVGYTGGNKTDPTYKEVCTSSTGHAEALQIAFDPKIVSYEDLIDFFFRMHDPTTINSQGPDVGTQYRSAIFTHSDNQQVIAEKVKESMKSFYKNPVVTEITPAVEFFDAEHYHQLYLDNNPEGYACPSHFLRTKPEVEKSEL